MKPMISSPASALFRGLLASLLVSVCLAGTGAQAQAQACERPAQLRFSVIPQGGMQQDIASLQPLLIVGNETSGSTAVYQIDLAY